MECYPFAQPVGPVTWRPPGPKLVLIIGVYPRCARPRSHVNTQ